MGLIKCPDCGGKVSDSAPMCIHCGRHMKRDYSSVDFNKTAYDRLSEELVNDAYKKYGWTPFLY